MTVLCVDPVRRYALRQQINDLRDFRYSSTHSSATPIQPHVLTSIDLSADMPHALDQEDIGSCAANAASNALRYCLRREGKAEFQPSRLFIYFFTRKLMGEPEGSDSGCSLRDVCRSLALFHVCPETAWPYDPSPSSRFALHPDAIALAAAAQHVKLAYHAVALDTAHIASCLHEGHPIIIGITLFSSFESQHVAETGIVPMPDTANEEMLGGHAVLLVGVDFESKHFKVLNSWGASWGVGGYFFLPFEYLLDASLCQGGLWTFRLFE